MAQALHQALHHRIGHGRVFGQAAGEFHATQNECVGLYLGTHGGRMRLVVDQAHLSHIGAGLQRCQDNLAPAGVGGDDARTPRQNNGQAVRFFALLNDVFTALEAAFDHRPRNGFGLH